MPRASKLLPSIGHASSGALGTTTSTLLTYPLDLVNTRLKVQRQLRLDGTISESETYDGIVDAFRAIYEKEGGLGAFYAGVGMDVIKGGIDSFLWFLFYTWFRARRLHARDAAYLNTVEELAVGAAAGACAKLFTTPVGNVVTRRQTASLLNGKPSRGKSFMETVAEIRREKGVLGGLWAGYSASLVLTLNPSMTFFLQQALKRMLIPRERWDEPGGRATFLLAALSKVAATSVTYPVQIAKARVQVSAKHEKEEGEKGLSGLVRETIFGRVVSMARKEGVTALYDGIGGELLKGFFSHGTTMMTKDIIHAFLVRFYLGLLVFLQRYPGIRKRLLERIQGMRDGVRARVQITRALSQVGMRELKRRMRLD